MREIFKKIDYFHSKEDTDPRNLLLILIVYIRNALYILSDNYVLKILDISNISNSSFYNFDFNHPYLVKLDTIHHPYKDYPFIREQDRNYKDSNLFLLNQ